MSTVASLAFAREADQQRLHDQLRDFGRRRLRPLAAMEAPLTPAEEARLRTLEEDFLQAEFAAVQVSVASVPASPRAFIDWFEALREQGPGQFDPLFDWLAERAELPELRWFLSQELAGEAGFDDLAALTQLGMPPVAKLEIARNYWDEMGRGRLSKMHGLLLQRVATHLRLPHVPTVWQSLALANGMAGMALNRHYAFHAVGALGAVELTAPDRVERVHTAMRRLGLPRRVGHYHLLHASLDRVHWRDWRDGVIAPLVEAYPQAMPRIAAGALVRLRAGARCFECYRRHLAL